jgi:hypothetical protein
MNEEKHDEMKKKNENKIKKKRKKNEIDSIKIKQTIDAQSKYLRIEHSIN